MIFIVPPTKGGNGPNGPKCPQDCTTLCSLCSLLCKIVFPIVALIAPQMSE